MKLLLVVVLVIVQCTALPGTWNCVCMYMLVAGLYVRRVMVCNDACTVVYFVHGVKGTGYCIQGTSP